MKCLLLFAIFAAASAASVQNPKVLDALTVLRGNKEYTVAQMFDLIANAVPGQDYPINAEIPDSTFDCSKYAPGFYADITSPSKCQVFHRCDLNGVQTSYLCTNGSVSMTALPPSD